MAKNFLSRVCVVNVDETPFRIAGSTVRWLTRTRMIDGNEVTTTDATTTQKRTASGRVWRPRRRPRRSRSRNPNRNRNGLNRSGRLKS